MSEDSQRQDCLTLLTELGGATALWELSDDDDDRRAAAILALGAANSYLTSAGIGEGLRQPLSALMAALNDVVEGATPSLFKPSRKQGLNGRGMNSMTGSTVNGPTAFYRWGRTCLPAMKSKTCRI